MNRKSSVFLLITLIVVTGLVGTGGCGEDNSVAQEEASSVNGVNYADSDNWIALPSIEKEVDVFYVYPTISANASGSMDITDERDRALAQGIFAAQASVYESDANVFAPYYRQMSTAADISQAELATNLDVFKLGAADVEDAFDYYINNLNEGRPFILAGHSQGTMALIELIKNRFGDDEEIRNQMVAAYLIGYTVTDEDLAESGLTAAEGANDTGVVITYNTQSATSEGGPMLLPGAHCINPLNWKTDATYAPASENLGARFYNDSTGEFLREVDNYCGAEVDLEKGALITELPESEVLDLGPQGEGVYHRYDFPFFYRNLEENVGDRIIAYQNEGALKVKDLQGKELGVPVTLPPFDPEKDVPKAPDYNNPDSWLTMPAHFSSEQQPVDVFWVYPTILSDESTYLMDIYDSDLREKATWTLVEQASIFDGQANIYAPYYRQNNVKINPLMLTDAKPIFDLGQKDLINAFNYFMENFNKGERPIILAAHSQGSVRVVELSKAGELLTGDPESLEKLIAAYVIGYSVTQSDLNINPLMKICKNSTDTGCFITYNTISDEKGKESQAPTVLPRSFVVNPLTWKTDTVFAPASANIEAVFFKHENPEHPNRYPNFAAAQVVNNALVITNISNPEELPTTSVTFPEGVYHMYDYAIFYENLRTNVEERINSYFEW
ncbi:MAG: DUF3089 domain-containing protein [Deltaproteobacteria bacterium]|nr:DUF3089 domain-containing protein [Deltaproteobacteria bacterium]